MASNRMSEEDKKSITDEVDNLLGRGVGFLPCPITDSQDLLQVINSRVPKELVAACELVIRSKMNLNAMSQLQMPYAPFGVPTVTYTLMSSSAYVAYPQWMHKKLRETMSAFTVNELSVLVGRDKADAFEQWAQDVIRFSQEAGESYDTITAIIKMSMTPGQLRRMLPDLVLYMPHRIQRLLKSQQRASSMPFEWAAFPREGVYRAAAALAKCHLLPTSENSVAWTHRNHHSWLKPLSD